MNELNNEPRMLVSDPLLSVSMTETKPLTLKGLPKILFGNVSWPLVIVPVLVI